jgi:outer membrane protein assembly factor BamB
MNRVLTAMLIAYLSLTNISSAEILSQWRGPNRTGIYPESNLLKSWPKDGPQMLWSASGIGEGFSSPAVTKDKIFVTGYADKKGYLYAFSLDGKLLWKKNYGPEYDGDYPGVRTTPTVIDNRIYINSGPLTAYCLDAVKGDIVWSVDMVQRFGARMPRWGLAESPLVDGNHVICTPGSENVLVAALDRMTGRTVWTCKGNGDTPSYCSPVLVIHNGKRLIATMTQKSIVGIDADNGVLLWQFPHKTDWDVNANTPLYQDGCLFCLSGYGTGSVKLQLSQDGKSVKEIWRNKSLDSQFGAAVLVNGYIYGSGQNSRGWKCLDFQSGVEKWSVREVAGKGNVICADGMLYLYGENGQVALVKPDPTAFLLVNSFKITQGTNQHWAHLVINQGRLYVRHGDVLMVYQISAK